ncbi:MAG: methyltransferase family protein [Solirubrobacteraceae bacterium]
MSRPVLGSALFVLVGPLFELALLPWVLTGFSEGDDLPAAWPLRAFGALVLLAAVGVLIDAFVRFAREGEGTPSPLAPPVNPVRGGVYGRLRHPMYVAATAGLAGEAFLLRQPILLLAAALYALTMAVLVRTYEEPLLRRRFGEHWRSSSGGGPRG